MADYTGSTGSASPRSRPTFRANRFLAAAGLVAAYSEADEDLRRALRGEITFDEVVERAAAHAARQGSQR